MLHKIILENYRSFGTRGEISLYPNPKRTFYPSHIYSGEELLYPVLKHCLIVGPNASGKTNLVKGMKFIKEFCCGQQHHDPKDKWLNRWYYDNRMSEEQLEYFNKLCGRYHKKMDRLRSRRRWAMVRGRMQGRFEGLFRKEKSAEDTLMLDTVPLPVAR